MNSTVRTGLGACSLATLLYGFVIGAWVQQMGEGTSPLLTFVAFFVAVVCSEIELDPNAWTEKALG